jgi:hypothetical protein
MRVKRMILTAAVALLGLPVVAAAHPPPRVVVGVGPYYPRPYYYYPRPAVGFGLYVAPPPAVVVVPARPVVVVPPAVQVVPAPAAPVPAPPSGP